jgi:hypothetical protein
MTATNAPPGQLPQAALDLLSSAEGRYSEWSTASAIAMHALNAGYKEDEFVQSVMESPFAYTFATENGRDRSNRLESRLRKVWSKAEEGWTPPLGDVQDVRRKLEELSQRLAGRRWSGRTGSSDRAVALTLVEWAHEVGVWTLDASSRQLSLRASVARATAEKSLGRLQQLGVLRRDASQSRTSTHAQRWVLQLGWRDRDIVSPHDLSIGGRGVCGLVTSLSHPAFVRAALGQTAERVWSDLVENPDATAAEVSGRLGVTPKTARRTLDKLVDHRLALVSGTKATTRPAATYRANPEGSLSAVADEYGTSDWRERTAERYDRERAGYAEVRRQRTTQTNGQHEQDQSQTTQTHQPVPA